MTRIEELFAKGRRDILNMYCTAGYPELESTRCVMLALQSAGADMIELGIPYSDPLADGPVIQHSSTIALANGMNLQVLFNQLQGFRSEIHVPVVLMGYLNPVMQYGFEKFCADAAAAGVDGIILPDMPLYEFERKYGVVVKQYDLDFIFLVTPETPKERVELLDRNSSGFLYAVSSSSTTGSDKNMPDVTTYLERLKSYQLKNPVLVGFGIKDRETFQRACQYSDGAIIGSAYIAALEAAPDIEKTTTAFIHSIKGGKQ